MKRLMCAAALLLVLSLFPQAFGLQDTYNQEYDHYMRAEAEQDPAKRQAILLEFVSKYPQSELDPNVSYLYAQGYQQLRAASRWNQLATAAEKFLRHRPNDTPSIAAATEAYQNLGDLQKLVDFGGKLYAESPNAGTAYFVAKAYQNMNNQAQFRKWAERAVRHDPENVSLLADLTNAYWGGRDYTRAAEYATRGLKAADSARKPGSQSAEQWQSQMNQLRAFFHRSIGEKAYLDREMTTALKHFETAVKLDSRNDFGHYRLGYIQWGTGRTNQAMISFARAFVLDGPSSKDARDQLYQLYRNTHADTAGISTLIQGVREEMGE